MHAQLAEIVGPAGLVSDGTVSERSAMPPYHCGADLLVRPATTEQLSRIMRLCNEHGQRVVVHGGRTSLSDGCSSEPGDIIISLERMTELEVDPAGRTATAGAGVIIQALQDKASELGLLFAVDWGARGSATVGGAIATNAGGNQVLRYGMMREQVLGLEVVLADGTIVSSMSRVLKNNAGYDLKQLFIGSEGTLGIVTRAVLRLRPLLPASATALIAVDRFEALAPLLARLETGLEGRLTSFEVMWRSYYELAAGTSAPPLGTGHAHMVLAEARGASEDELTERMVYLLASALGEGLVSEALFAKSGRERADWWAIRDNFRSLSALGPLTAFDVSVPIGEVPAYLADVEAALAAEMEGAPVAVFGHLGDQNIHVVVGHGAGGADGKAIAERAVYQSLAGRGGSMSAEHGIGLAKREWLSATRSAAEIALMRQMKALFDPKDILNPGRVV